MLTVLLCDKCMAVLYICLTKTFFWLVVYLSELGVTILRIQYMSLE